MSLVPLPGYLSLVLPQCDFMYCTATDQHAVNLRSFRDLVMNHGDKADEVPPRCSNESPAMGQRIYDTARVQRTSQVAFIRDRLDQGLSSATVAGVAAIIAQMESQTQAPMLTISITSGFPGFQRSMTFQEGVWFGHDLTHHFTDDRAAISYSLPSGGVHQTSSLQIPSCPPPPPPVPASQSAARAGEPPGSQARPLAPAPPDMTNRPLAEQAVISALQAVAIDPHYSDFMTSMERCWPELRQITLPTVTIQSTSALTAPSALTVPHVNPLSEQPGHSRTVTMERSRSSSRSSSSHKGGGEPRPASRKRNDRSPTRTSTSAIPPMAVRDSPSSKPPPDKRVSNEKTTPASIEVPMTVNASDHTKTMVSEAPMLPSPPPSQSTEGQGIMQPLPPSHPTSRESLA